MAYESRCLDRLIETRDALNDRSWRPSRTLAFVVEQPKAREIHAADFGDRVVHHWLTPRLEAWFEPVFIHDSYSNRKGKGTHAAVDRLQGFIRQATRNGKVKAYYLQLDIANFFNSIDRRILYELIRHRGERVWRAEKKRILGPDSLSYPGAPGNNLPKTLPLPEWEAVGGRVTTSLPSGRSAHPVANPKRPGGRTSKSRVRSAHHGEAEEGKQPRRQEPAPVTPSAGLPEQTAAATAVERHAEINDCLWLCRTLLEHDAGAQAVERGDGRSFAKVPAHKRLKNAPAGVGLPIGNLTSQFFANVYLDRLDQFVKHQLKCRHYLRYVDDFVLLHEDPGQLLAWRREIENFLAETLALRLKALSEPGPVGGGIDFLGYVIRRTYRLVRRRVLRQAATRLAGFADRLVRPVKGGWRVRWTPALRERMRAGWSSTLGHLSHAAGRRQARELWRRHPWARSGFAFDPDRYRLYNRYEPPSVASYTGQKRWFARRFPALTLLVQKGWEYEVVNGPADAVAANAGAAVPAPTPFIPASRLGQQIAVLRRAGRGYVVVGEEGYLKHGLKRRVLAEIGWPNAPVPPPRIEGPSANGSSPRRRPGSRGPVTC